jgi:hypothetical protein
VVSCQSLAFLGLQLGSLCMFPLPSLLSTLRCSHRVLSIRTPAILD